MRTAGTPPGRVLPDRHGAAEVRGRDQLYTKFAYNKFLT